MMSSIFLVLVLLFSSNFAYAQVSATLPPESPVYRAIDVLVSKKLVDDIIMGQRPFTRDEAARIVKGAYSKFNEREKNNKKEDFDQFVGHHSESDYLKKIFDFCEKELGEDFHGRYSTFSFSPLKKLSFVNLIDTEQPRPIPPDNGQGSIIGDIASFSDYQQGRPYIWGVSNWFEAEQELRLTPYFVVNSISRAEALFPRGDDSGLDLKFHVHSLYGAAGWRDVRLQIGRDNLLWGQGEFGGLMLSSNPRPLDMIKLESPHPFRLPSFLRYIGSMKGTLFASNLGPQNYYPYAWLYGFKWSIKPAKILELGISETVIIGGDGAPKIEWWEPIAELFPFHKWGGKNIGATDISDHRFGIFDARINIPPLRGATIYFETMFDDSFIRALRLPDNFLRQTNIMAGFYFPSLNKRGDVALRLQYDHSPPFGYRHGNWRSGYTLDGRVIGDPIGSTADGVYGKVYWWPTLNLRTDFEFGFERFDSSRFISEIDPNTGGNDRVLKDTHDPCEYRYRLMGNLAFPINDALWFNGRLGYEYVQNFNFNVGRNVSNMIVLLGVDLKFPNLKIQSR